MSDGNSIFDIKKLFLGTIFTVIFSSLIVIGSKYVSSNLGADFVENVGAFGIYLCLLFIDSIPTPGGSIPILTLSIQGGIPILYLAALSVLASYTAGILGFVIGRFFGIPTRWSQALEQKFPKTFEKVRKHQTYGFVFLVALPIPMSLVGWFGASFSLRLQSLLIGGLVRIPKILLYLLATFSSVSLL